MGKLITKLEQEMSQFFLQSRLERRKTEYVH